MPVDVRGRIVFNPDDKEQEYTLDCKQLGISEEASGSIEEDIETLREKVTNAILEEFHIEPISIQITGYTMTIGFEITGPPIHKTLDQFADEQFTGDKTDNDK